VFSADWHSYPEADKHPYETTYAASPTESSTRYVSNFAHDERSMQFDSGFWTDPDIASFPWLMETDERSWKWLPCTDTTPTHSWTFIKPTSSSAGNNGAVLHTYYVHDRLDHVDATEWVHRPRWDHGLPRRLEPGSGRHLEVRCGMQTATKYVPHKLDSYLRWELPGACSCHHSVS
jgi:hypothetical protein